MKKRPWVATTMLVGIVTGLATISQPPAQTLAMVSEDAAAADNASGAGVFGLTKVHEFHLEVAAKEWEKMQPAGGMGFPMMMFGGPGAAKQAPPQSSEKSADIHKGGSFGIEFPWVHATLTAAGE